jgi:hypothetical protein
MIAALLLAAAAPSAIDAERAFAADAQRIGQWTAFRKWSTEEALMFVPEPTKAHEFLKGRTDPPEAVSWRPNASFTSCDGVVAAIHGPWRRPDESEGSFFTIWERRQEGDKQAWRWVFDAGIRYGGAFPSRSEPIEHKASCVAVPKHAKPKGIGFEAWGGSRGTQNGQGMSLDRSLAWFWSYSKEKGTWLHVEMWNGREFQTMMDVQAAAP